MLGGDAKLKFVNPTEHVGAAYWVQDVKFIPIADIFDKSNLVVRAVLDRVTDESLFLSNPGKYNELFARLVNVIFDYYMIPLKGDLYFYFTLSLCSDLYLVHFYYYSDPYDSGCWSLNRYTCIAASVVYEYRMLSDFSCQFDRFKGSHWISLPHVSLSYL